MFPKDSLQPGIRRASRANAFAAGRAHVSKTGNPDSGRHPTETGPIQGLSGQTARPKFRWARVQRARMSWAHNARALCLSVRGRDRSRSRTWRCGSLFQAPHRVFLVVPGATLTCTRDMKRVDSTGRAASNVRAFLLPVSGPPDKTPPLR